MQLSPGQSMSFKGENSMKGLLSQIQHYSTKDGPGIRTTVFMMGCNLRCKWCANPETISPCKKIMYYKQKCMRCGSCVQAAVNGSIRLGKDGCVIDRERCTNLSEMVLVCPYDAYEERGKEYSAKELYKKLARDMVFYQKSNGGVTFSGGEACLQHEFVLETVKLLKQDGIHVTLDTAGLWDFETVKPLLAAVDLVLYDIKAYNEELHRSCTGVGNSRILENAKKIAGMGKELYIRLIMVPGVNDLQEDVKERFRFVKSLGNMVKQVDILPYHTLGIGKYLSLGLQYPLEEIKEYSEEEKRTLLDMAKEAGIKATIGG